MILISDVEHVAQEHYDACAPEIKKRIRFLVDFFQLLSDKNFIIVLKKKQLLSNYYDLNAETMKSMVEPFIKSKVKKTKYTIGKLTQIFTTGSAKNDFIYNPKQYKEYQVFFKEVDNQLETILKGKPKDLFDKVLEDVSVP